MAPSIGCSREPLGGRRSVSVHILRMRKLTRDEVTCPGSHSRYPRGWWWSQRCEPPPACSHFQLLGRNPPLHPGQSVGSFLPACSPLSASTLQERRPSPFTEEKTPARFYANRFRSQHWEVAENWGLNRCFSASELKCSFHHFKLFHSKSS